MKISFEQPERTIGTKFQYKDREYTIIGYLVVHETDTNYTNVTYRVSHEFVGQTIKSSMTRSGVERAILAKV